MQLHGRHEQLGALTLHKFSVYAAHGRVCLTNSMTMAAYIADTSSMALQTSAIAV